MVIPWGRKMPIKRRAPKQRRETVPAWAERLLAGTLPERDGDGWDGWLAWLHLGDDVPGLPLAMSNEGKSLWAGKLS